MSHKTLDVPRLKAAEDDHVIDFYAAAFSKTPDKQGDLIDPHAFDVWLKAFYTAGKPLPISFAHEAVLASGQVQMMKEMIGYAPATPEHVFVDEYGLRIKAILFDEAEALQVYTRAKAGLINGASIAYHVVDQRPLKSGAMLLTEIVVGEAGPCLEGANDDAYVVGVKTATPVHHTETYDSPWDAGQARADVPNDATAAQLAAMFAWRDQSANPDAKTSYRFIHHTWDNGPGAANVTACSATVAVLNGGRGVDVSAQPWSGDRQKIFDHVIAHLKDAGVEQLPELKTVETKHGGAPTYIQAAHDALAKAGAKCASSESEKTHDEELGSETFLAPEEVEAPEVDPLTRLRLVAAAIERGTHA